jgi:hypothetical protein
MMTIINYYWNPYYQLVVELPYEDRHQHTSIGAACVEHGSVNIMLILHKFSVQGEIKSDTCFC